MIVKIKKRENPFAMIDRTALEDSRLSWRARGVLAYLLSKPDDWEVSVQNVINKGKEGREAIRAVFRELSKFGYCELENVRSESGTLAGKRYVIYEQPKDGFSVDRTDRPETRPSGNPTVGKPVDIVIRTGSNKKEAHTQSEKSENELPTDYTPAYTHLIDYLKANPHFIAGLKSRSGFTGQIAPILQDYLCKMQERGEWYQLRIPTDAADHQRWIAKILAGVEGWAKVRKNNPRRKPAPGETVYEPPKNVYKPIRP